jgi:hypothetical protein
VDYQIDNFNEVESIDNPVFWCDVFFLAFYSVEFMIKLGYYRLFYFYDVHWKYNILDLVLLIGNLWSVTYTAIVSGNQLIQNFTWLRSLRLLRLLKTLRVLKLAAHFQTLRAILVCLSSTSLTLFWSLLMLGVVYLMCALVMVARIATFFNTAGVDLDESDADLLMRWFGSVSVAVESFVLASTGGKDWGDFYFYLASTDTLNQYIFLFFIAFIQLALLNIILGIFVDTAMKSLEPDPVQKAQNYHEEERHLKVQLHHLCNEVDARKTGKFTEAEWQEHVERGRVGSYLALLGFHPQDVHQLFDIVSKRSDPAGGAVDIDDLVRACIALKGTASRFDLVSVRSELTEMKELLLKEPACSPRTCRRAA